MGRVPGPGRAQLTFTVASSRSLDRLLALLDADREKAGERYEVVRHRLLKFFTWHGAPFPEEMADETIDRVMKRLEEGQVIQTTDPLPYFFGVARNVLRESWRRPGPTQAPSAAPAAAPEPPAGEEQALGECLDHCLHLLADPTRRLVMTYYEGGPAGGIAVRRAQAAQMGVSLPALRLRVHRIRARLEACVRRCAEGETEPPPAPPRIRRRAR